MLKGLKDRVPRKIKNYYHLCQAILALGVYRYPAKKLKVIGVTGTDGKTTTVNLIYEILKVAKKQVSMISTVKAKIGHKNYDTGLHTTTPSPIEYQNLLKKMVDDESEFAVVEATSHGLDQNRVYGSNFYIGVITNITHEHLDYHKTYVNYLKVKAKLLDNVKYSVLNRDDESFDLLMKEARGEVISYGIKDGANVMAADIKYTPRGTEFSIKSHPASLRLTTPLIGEFNVYNALAAVSVAKILEIEDSVVQKALKGFKGILGRMELIDEGQDFGVVVDFAHTPNGLEKALKTLRKVSKGRLIAVFGSAGERDVGKRALMGRVSAELADLTVVTAEDPRSERVEDIMAQIEDGIEEYNKVEGKNYFKIADRKEAIKFTIQKLAKKDDLVACFGKGHERSMNIGGKEYPWNEQNVVRDALREILTK